MVFESSALSANYEGDSIRCCETPSYSLLAGIVSRQCFTGWDWIRATEVHHCVTLLHATSFASFHSLEKMAGLDFDGFKTSNDFHIECSKTYIDVLLFKNQGDFDTVSTSSITMLNTLLLQW